MAGEKWGEAEQEIAMLTYLRLQPTHAGALNQKVLARLRAKGLIETVPTDFQPTRFVEALTDAGRAKLKE